MKTISSKCIWLHQVKQTVRATIVLRKNTLIKHYIFCNLQNECLSQKKDTVFIRLLAAA